MSRKRSPLFTTQFISSTIILLLILVAVACQAQEHRVVIRVVVPPSTPNDATIYIAGNAPRLGDWNPGKVAMTKENDSTWSFSGSAPSGAVVEFKITRGSWNTQAMYVDGVIPPNVVFKATADTLIELRPATWNDLSSVLLANKRGGGIVGTVKYHRGLKGDGLKHERDAIVWLPPSYEKDVTRRYSVLYMHDGQNVFDPNTSFIGYDWRADEIADSLIKADAMEEVIIVGIYNTPDRIPEYSDTELGRSYARFVVKKLKPLIDSTYRTMTDPRHTAVMGSSMGGLISLLFVWWYPEVFGQAGCLSTAVSPIRDDRLLDEIRNYDGPRKPIRVYFDVGEFEPSLIPGYEALVALLQKKGYEREKDLEYFFDNGAPHNERAWANRLWRPLLFMFHK